MKLIKYIINLIILTGSIYFLLELSKINELETGGKMTVKIPFISGEAGMAYELEVWLAVLAVLTVGVLLGFFIAWFTLTGTAQDIVGIAIIVSTVIWLLTIYLRD